MRGIVLKQVAEYFASKGRYMTYQEYKEQTDAPVSAAVLKRVTGGSWTRVKARIAKYYPELDAKIISEPEVEVDPEVEVEPEVEAPKVAKSKK